MSELEKTVADMLTKATNAAEAAGKFAVEQLPDIAQQYVMYIAVYNGIFILFGLFLLISSPFIGARTCRNGDGYSMPTKTQGVWIFGASGWFIGCAFILANLKEFILAVFAPKILLIQWAAELVK